MADIIDLIRADHRHIMIWQVKLRELRRQGRDLDHRQALASTWNAVANMIDAHIAAEDEILGLPIRDSGIRDPAAVRHAIDAHENLREIIRESRLQPPGSPLWWRLAAAAQSAWADEVHRQERCLLPGLADRTSFVQREELCRQWRAFTEARIRDQILDAPSQVATCQLRRTRPVRNVPPVAAIIFDPVCCTCPDCDVMADRIASVLSVRPPHAPPPRATPATLTLSHPFAGMPDLVVTRVCEQVIAEVVGEGFADMANVQVVDPASGALRIIAQVGFKSQFLEFFDIVRGEESACGVALANARPVWVPDVVRSPVFDGTPAGDVVLGADVRSVASVPVRAHDGSVIAMISTHRRTPGPWTRSQRRHLEELAAHTGQLLSRVR